MKKARSWCASPPRSIANAMDRKPSWSEKVARCSKKSEPQHVLILKEWLAVEFFSSCLLKCNRDGVNHANLSRNSTGGASLSKSPARLNRRDQVALEAACPKIRSSFAPC